MTKHEIIAKVRASNPNLSLADITLIVDSIFNIIRDYVSNGGRVEFRGFGSFCARHRAARIGHNPKTGGTINIPAKNIPFFKAGKKMLEEINK